MSPFLLPHVGCRVRVAKAFSPFLFPLLFSSLAFSCPLLHTVSALPRPCLPSLLVSLCWKLCCLFFQRRCLPSLPSCPPSFFTLLDVVSEALSPFFPFLGSCVRVPDAVSAFLSPFASPFLSRFWFPFVGCCVRLTGAVSPFLLPFVACRLRTLSPSSPRLVLFPLIGCCGRPLEALSSLPPFMCPLCWMLCPPFGGLVSLVCLLVSPVLEAVHLPFGGLVSVLVSGLVSPLLDAVSRSQGLVFLVSLVVRNSRKLLGFNS